MSTIYDNVPLYSPTRHGKKWTIPEELRLHREYELLRMPVDYIAYLHDRVPEAIISKVEKEGFDRPCKKSIFSLSKNMNHISMPILYLALVCFFVLYFV